MKHIKLILTLLACITFASCSKKAPNPGSSEVEDLATEIIVQQSFRNGPPEGFEMEIVDIITIAVDDKARSTKFSFVCRVKDDKHSAWVKRTYRYKALASYSDSGDLFMEVFNKYNEPNW